MPSKSLALTLSGGGHRATLFGLGALIYVVDSGRQKQTTSISSVSGGSITNGLVGQEVDFQETTPDEFAAKVAGPLALQVAKRGTLFAPFSSKLYLALLVLVGLSIPAVFFVLPGRRGSTSWRRWVC